MNLEENKESIYPKIETLIEYELHFRDSVDEPALYIARKFCKLVEQIEFKSHD